MKQSRQDMLVRAAKLRAAITALVNGADKAGIAFTTLREASAIKELLEDHKQPESTLRGALHSLVDNNLLRSEKRGREVVYLKGGGKPAQGRKVGSKNKSPKKPKLELTQAKLAEGDMKHLKIAVVEKTGNLRILYKGLALEIGVVAE